MYMKPVYYFFIVFLFAAKIAYLIVTARLYYTEYENPDDDNITVLLQRSERLFAISSAGIIVALLIDFGHSLFKGEQTIKVDRLEQFIYFISGLLGLTHMNWNLILFNR